MGSLRKHLSRLFLGLIPLLQATPSCAQSPSTDPVYLFATCTGRFSALIEHQWLVSDPASDQTEHLRDAMVDLLEAALPAERTVQAMAWRLEAKVAAAGLLHQVAFGRTPAYQTAAERQFAALMANCRALLANDDTA